jgi:hypothetical protein
MIEHLSHVLTHLRKKNNMHGNTHNKNDTKSLVHYAQRWILIIKKRWDIFQNYVHLFIRGYARKFLVERFKTQQEQWGNDLDCYGNIGHLLWRKGIRIQFHSEGYHEGKGTELETWIFQIDHILEILCFDKQFDDTQMDGFFENKDPNLVVNKSWILHKEMIPNEWSRNSLMFPTTFGSLKINQYSDDKKTHYTVSSPVYSILIYLQQVSKGMTTKKFHALLFHALPYVSHGQSQMSVKTTS